MTMIAPPKDRRIGRRIVYVVIALALVGAGYGIGHAATTSSGPVLAAAAPSSASPPVAPAQTTAPAQTVSAPAPVAAPPPDTLTDGTYAVPADAKPGRYHTNGVANGPTDPGLCYWSRSKDTSGDASAIIANDTPNGPATVTIKSTDGAFETRGCQTWTKVG